MAHSCAIFQSQPLSLWAFLSPPITLFAVLAVIRQAVDNFALEKTFNKILSLLGLFKNQWGEFLKKLDLPGKRVEDIQKEYELLTTTRRQQPERPLNEAPRSKLRGIKAEFAEANPPSLFKLRR
ncbi:MAG: DNA recombination protein RmuC, partial [Proteobacteria bacterium]|nr:DNA recombination protein RmuC [Pseudomonadota bacterium]